MELRTRRTGRRLWPAAALLALAMTGCSQDAGDTPQAGGSASVGSDASASAELPEPSKLPATATATASTQPSGPTRTRTAAPGPAASFGGLEMAKSGGFAGVSESVTIKPDGTWTRLDGRKVTGSGKLSAAQMAELGRLASDPGLAAEAGRKVSGGRCADAFQYTLHVNYRLIRYEQCGAADKPKVTLQIINFVDGATT